MCLPWVVLKGSPLVRASQTLALSSDVHIRQVPGNATRDVAHGAVHFHIRLRADQLISERSHVSPVSTWQILNVSVGVIHPTYRLDESHAKRRFVRQEVRGLVALSFRSPPVPHPHGPGALLPVGLYFHH